MRVSQLEGRRLALWGWGREGRAAYRVLRGRFPTQPLTLFCSAAEADEVAALADPALQVRLEATGQALAAFEVVVKSPGISPYGEAAAHAVARGTALIGGSTLWFGERANAQGIVEDTVAVTGTKGKSTTTALLAHLLRAAGRRTALVGNIGVPLLEVLDPQPPPQDWAVELSSYQTRDVALSGAAPAVAIVLNLFPEHLDWHGSQQRYIEDKLALVTVAHPRIAVLNAADPLLSTLVLPQSQVHWFNQPQGWHLRGNDLHRGERFVLDTTTVPVPGRHNRSNLCAVLTAIEALGLDGVALAAAATTFRPLPNRLQTLGTREGITWINDSISTTPHASLAALECVADGRQPVAILLGGHDRGLDWDDFAKQVTTHCPEVVVTMGQNGPRIHALLRPLAEQGRLQLLEADTLASAVQQARARLGETGVMLLSPGAPSYGAYKDYVARGKHFAALGGFDPESIVAIPGLGIA
ncbi:UDP-N-acetylmuramoyl-L-alanine--D-glutamate ligase [Pseudoxanthomonas composti]|uniref:UDP-N-acetylmuramoyl-L-alanine--L-glutamate ligase n=1 Tax=Pseudoxanthomonas composti TaxID=2137479 RepID=A0A4Q1JZ17_9GAMM|nr:UDP-N-acetylmuramoyl-L-alanine--D-glutamate ligase [Pseudoxanthomonas composti]RXR08574.1 UDP-N-acetylmuramoyl-L-alanine--D-glutamate ligase [Pseudoxanthomonas composti]